MHMRREIEEIPEAVARLAAPEMRARLEEAAGRLRAADPAAVLSVARGSSDHAATYLKYAVEVTLGLPVASVGPSTVTVHQAQFRTDGLAAFAISQSGASGDLAALVTALGRAGSHTVALTNTAASPLADAAGDVIDIAAGPENAVAATKSYVNSIACGLWLIGFWSGDRALLRALDALPDALAGAVADGPTEMAAATLEEAENAMVIGRGAGLGIALEVALKLIETCGLHASAYSGAEVLHGPRAILSEGFPVIALQSGAARGMAQAISQLSEQGAGLILFPDCRATGHPLVDPLVDMPVLYRFLEALSRARGMSTDAPRFLSKETKTL